MKKVLESSRYLALIGVFCLLIASAIAFGWGALKTFKIVVALITTDSSSQLAVSLVGLMDAFLVAAALFIFSVSLYELFIEDLNLPNWMLAHNLYELKSKLSNVIILVMAVNFLEHLIEWKDPQGTLLLGGAIAIVSGMLIALSYVHHKDE